MMGGVVKFIGVVEEIDNDVSVIRINEEYSEGLEGLEKNKTINILFWLHQRDTPEHRKTLKVVPKRHGETEPRGVFSTHSQSRHNPIGLTVVELLKINDDRLYVRGLDAYVGSPIIDIKPVGSLNP